MKIVARTQTPIYSQDEFTQMLSGKMKSTTQVSRVDNTIFSCNENWLSGNSRDEWRRFERRSCNRSLVISYTKKRLHRRNSICRGKVCSAYDGVCWRPFWWRVMTRRLLMTLISSSQSRQRLQSPSVQRLHHATCDALHLSGFRCQ